MSDPYLDKQRCVDRLLDEYHKYGRLIVAYDYDNTVFDYHQQGATFNDVIELLRECRRLGFHLILFTSCDSDRYPEIKEYLHKQNIPYDAINETPDFIPFNGRKVYYNVLLDDRAGLSSAFEYLWKAIYTIRGFLANQNLYEMG